MVELHLRKKLSVKTIALILNQDSDINALDITKVERLIAGLD